MAGVRYVAVSRVYAKGAQPAVDALDLDVKDGEFMVLVGPSGSGKTTALRMLAGLEPLDLGRIEIDGRDVSDVPPKDRDIAMVFQNYALYPSKSVAENMGFALKMQHVPKSERDRRVREAARILDLDEQLLDRRPKQLSGGQRQRVAMGRAIVREPKVFLMDEPLSNLDAKLRVQTRSQIAELQRRLGVTTVYVTHDQVEAMTMGHRVAVLSGGKLQQCASPRELYDNPVNQFVAGFIGSPAMNLQTAALTDGGARLAGTVIPLAAAVRAAAGREELSELVIGIRPEHMHLTAGAARSAGGSGTASSGTASADTGSSGAGSADKSSAELSGEVLLVEELGADALLHVRLADGGGAVVVRTEGRATPVPGQRVTFRVQSADVLAFHPVTGARLAGQLSPGGDPPGPARTCREDPGIPHQPDRWRSHAGHRARPSRQLPGGGGAGSHTRTRSDRRQGGLLRDLRHGPAHHGWRVPADALPDHARPRVRRDGRGHRGRCRDRPARGRPCGGGPVAVLRILPTLPVRP
jgi:multiple sugar transport system ATP-binding protein